jgi:ABC-type antimicrobial peptide transport system permease subunit
MQARVDASIWQQRVASTVLVLFAAIAVSLASLGTYAVTAHAVAAQRREIAIRLALGSSPSGIGWLVMRQWVTPVVLGTLVGMIAGLVVARALAQTIGMTMPHLLASLMLPIVLIGAAALACAVPARRVIRRLALTDVLRAQ